MSNVTALRSERPQAEPAQPYLGPAKVMAVETGAVHVRLPGGAVVMAWLALPIPYQPSIDDSVLVIGNPDGHYVIGVLAGTGRTVLELPGTVELRAEGGPLRLSSSHAVHVDAPEIALRASRLGMVAEAVVETFSSLRQRVCELWSMHAGQSHSVTDGTAISQAESTTIVSRGKVTINGKAIHLG